MDDEDTIVPSIISCGSACLPLLILVALLHPHLESPHLPLSSQKFNLKFSPTIVNLQDHDLTLLSKLCEFFWSRNRPKSAPKKLQRWSTKVGGFLVVNGCSKQRSFQLLIPRFAAQIPLMLNIRDICDIYVTPTILGINLPYGHGPY